MVYIVGINGSPYDNEDANTAKALRTALSAAEQTGATTKFIHLSLQLPHHDGRRPEEADYEDRVTELLPDRGGLREVVAEILKADGVIFATSTNCFTANTRILALLAWLQTNVDAPDYRLGGKVAAFMSVCEEDGGQNANLAMLGPANHLGFGIPPFCTYFYNKLATESEGDWQETDRVLIGLNVRRQAQLNRGEIKVVPTYEMWNNTSIGEENSW